MHRGLPRSNGDENISATKVMNFELAAKIRDRIERF